MATDSNSLFRLAAIGVGVVLIDKVFGLFAPEKPGGDVPPGTGDDRPATINAAEAQALADRLYENLIGDQWIPRPWEYDGDAAATLMQCKVTRDVRLVMNAYATIGFIGRNLTNDVVSFLDSDYRAEVNANYTTKGIQIQF